MNKALLIPIVSLIGLIYKQVTHQELPNETLDILTDSILSVLTLVGIFMHPKSQKSESEKPDQDNQNQ